LYEIYRAEFNIELPSYAGEYASAMEKTQIATLIRGGLGPRRGVPLPEARCGDALLFRIEGEPWHVGVLLDKPKFLHARRGTDTCIEDWTRPAWARRLLGVYRHETMA
jgi:cell wall-associated NlpC family hydrolase